MKPLKLITAAVISFLLITACTVNAQQEQETVIVTVVVTTPEPTATTKAEQQRVLLSVEHSGEHISPGDTVYIKTEIDQVMDAVRFAVRYGSSPQVWYFFNEKSQTNENEALVTINESAQPGEEVIICAWARLANDPEWVNRWEDCETFTIKEAGNE